MLFQRRVDRAFQWLKQRTGNDKQPEASGEGDLPSVEELRAEAQEEMELEKGDLFAMILSALIVILPVCLLALLAMVGFAFFL